MKITKPLNFTKMHGLGNDFVIIDAINQSITVNSELIRFLADRHFGVGCDQVLLVERPTILHVDFRYRIFNADGSEVEQCGNGARCFARFVRDAGLIQHNHIKVETAAGEIYLSLEENGEVAVNMGKPRFNPSDIPFLSDQEKLSYSVLVGEQQINCGVVSMGNPHCVLQVADLLHAPVATLGALLERHALFPRRVNVGFMEIIKRSAIKLRVYERGVGETLACGTGACAAVAVGIRQGLLDSPVTVTLPGGQLTIHWQNENAPIIMIGAAVKVFDGKIE